MYKDTTSKQRSMKLFDIEKMINNYETAIYNDIEPSISQELYNHLKIQLEKIENIVGPEF